MIQLIEAPPRSGKSYYAVNYLMKFCTFDGLYHEYILDRDCLVISNIEGLKVNHWNLDEKLKEQPLTEFFTIPNFERIMKETGKNHIVLMIDECHDYFPAGFKNDKIYSFFAFHGHIGLDIFLMTQGLEATTRMFNPLLEFIVKVTPRSKSIPGSFSYDFHDKSGKFMYSKPLRKKQLVFGAYKSFRKDEINKPKNAILHWVVIASVFFASAFFIFKMAVASLTDKSKGKVAPSITAPRTPPAAVPASQVAQVAPGQKPDMKIYSSVRSVIPDYSYIPPAPAPDLPRVIGHVGDVDGRNRKYLLSTGKTVTCKRQLNIGDLYIN